jgi:hypothetical protein
MSVYLRRFLLAHAATRTIPGNLRIVRNQIPVFDRKSTQTKIGVVRRKAALRPTYFHWRTGRFFACPKNCFKICHKI